MMVEACVSVMGGKNNMQKMLYKMDAENKISIVRNNLRIKTAHPVFSFLAIKVQIDRRKNRLFRY